MAPWVSPPKEKNWIKKLSEMFVLHEENNLNVNVVAIVTLNVVKDNMLVDPSIMIKVIRTSNHKIGE